MPDTVQGLIAARLDTPATAPKALLQDAAVIGKVFWAGALESMDERDEEAVRQGLHNLARKELVRPARLSSVEGQAEYAFWHALIRDVAYGQIPRSARAVKHLAVADWIEKMAGARLVDPPSCSRITRRRQSLSARHPARRATRSSSSSGAVPRPCRDGLSSSMSAAAVARHAGS